MTGAGSALRSEGLAANHSSKRVFLFGSYAPSLVNFRGPLIEAMVERGHRVIAGAPEIDEVIAARLNAMGAESATIALSNTSLNPIAMVGSYLELRRFLRASRPDVILSYTIKPVILGALAARSEKIGRVVSLITGLGYAFTGTGGSIGRRLSRLMATLLYRRALAQSDVILFQNQDDAAHFRKLGILADTARVEIVDGSGVDLDRFAPAPLQRGPSFLMIARLLWDKGIREFAAAAKRIRSEHPDVPIALVGYLDPSPDSLTEPQLQELIAAGIRFYGRLEDVRPAIAECSVYVLPSYREGTPRSVLEAMAMARAIITTDAPGCRETVVDGRNGFLVPVQDADALYAAMKRFITDPSLASRMGAESRKLAERRYDARKVSADILRHVGL